MTIQIQRYQIILESIPCFPESTSSVELKAILISANLLDPKGAEKSLMRTIQRDINKVLADHSSIELLDDSRPYRYQIAKGHKHPINPDAMSAAVSLQVIEQEIKNMLPPTLRDGVNHIFQTLKQKETKQSKLWRERFCYFPLEYQLLAPGIDQNTFSLIEQALLNDSDIKLQYQKRGATTPSQYHLTPLGVVLHGNSFYLIASVVGKPETYRTYALHRIHSIKLTYSTIEPKEHFDIRQHVLKHIPHFSGGSIDTIVLRVENYRGLHLIEETLLDPKQTVLAKDDTYTTIQAQVRISLALEWWLMKHANFIEVLQPTSLRHRVIESIKESMQLYQIK